VKDELVVYCLEWIAANAPLAVQLLSALVPVLALCVAGYAIHAVSQRERRGKK
jgi:hypothetical protein